MSRVEVNNLKRASLFKIWKLVIFELFFSKREKLGTNFRCLELNWIVRNNSNESYQLKQTTASWKKFSSSIMSDSESKNVPTSRPGPSLSPLKKKQPRGISFSAWKALNSNATHAPVWPFLIDILENFTQALATFRWGIPKQMGGGSVAVNQHNKQI